MRNEILDQFLSAATAEGEGTSQALYVSLNITERLILEGEREYLEPVSKF